ncbi:hypothetical protein ACQKKK_15835 [Peribacillus sp. NPDC006672]|uniref:hypothetical protein n=1 Tax=Peribacillus sp. NPDC006672 TaxID=3390606 RepID=UPI003D04791C
MSMILYIIFLDGVLGALKKDGSLSKKRDKVILPLIVVAQLMVGPHTNFLEDVEEIIKQNS